MEDIPTHEWLDIDVTKQRLPCLAEPTELMPPELVMQHRAV